MQARAGTPAKLSRHYSVKSLVYRTTGIFLLAAILATLVYGLISSDGITQKGSGTWQTSRRAAVIEVRIFPEVDDALLLDSLDDPVTRPVTLARPAKAEEVSDLAAVPKLYETAAFTQLLKESRQEAPGQVSRLESSVDNPLGGAAADNLLCIPFGGKAETVGIIGNGPISSGDRRDIDKLDVVVRFNLMNNWQRFQEKIDVWIMRFSTEARAGYWGINNINQTEADRIISGLKGIWLVGGKQSHADKLLEQHPHLKEHNPVLMPEAAMNKAFASGILDTPGSYPSTGFVGVQAALHCTPRTVKLHIFGFNWSKKTWAGHNVGAEQAYIEGLQDQDRAVIHRTACTGMRECGIGDIDASCHWSTDGHYMCLRGNPKQWKDMTALISESRRQEFRVGVQSAISL